MGIFIAYPATALGVGGAFAGMSYWRRARSAAMAGLLWLAYGGHECLIHLRILCSGECNIRVDLLVIYPLLCVVSLVAIWSTARGGGARAPRPGAPS